MTRAKSLLVLIGEEEVIRRAIFNHKKIMRYSHLRQRIISIFSQ